MSRLASMQGARGHLRVVAGEELLRPVDPVRLPSLDAQPTRPGEVPRSVIFTVDNETARLIAEHVSVAGVPAEVWVRVAVEATRVRSELSNVLRLEAAQVEKHLDEAVTAAALRRPSPPRSLRRNALEVYADQLRRASSSHAAAMSRRLGVAVSEREIAAWERDAREAGLPLAEFVVAALETAPSGAVMWEAESACVGRTLAEWGYRVVGSAVID